MVGVFVLVISALAGGVLCSNLGNRQPVLAVARDVEVGQVIDRSDLVEVLVAPADGVTIVRATSRAAVVGRTASVRLVKGSLLSPAQVAEGAAVDPDAAIVGAVLKAGQFPLGLRAGDRVLAIPLPSEAAAAAGDVEIAAPIAATVTAIERGDASGRGIAIALAVPPGDAPALAVAGARGRLTLVIAPR